MVQPWGSWGSWGTEGSDPESPWPLGLGRPQEQDEERDGGRGGDLVWGLVKGEVKAKHYLRHGKVWELGGTLGFPFSISTGVDPAPLTHRFTAASASWR